MNLYRAPEIHFGDDAGESLGKVLNDVGSHRLFIVTGPHVRKSAGFARLEAIARKERDVEIFHETTADPTIRLVKEISARARAFRADSVLGIGGGSPLDSAKIVAVMLDHDVTVESLVGVEKVPHRKTPLLMIPTTAGTASEVTIYSILTDSDKGMKAGVCSKELIPDYAFLIPSMTYSMPQSVTAATGIDALCHATEAYTSLKRNPYSDVMALRAVKLIAANLEIAFARPLDAEARGNMLLASLFAGFAFNNSSTTAVHAFAYPLGGTYHIPHGLANSLMFAAVFRHNTPGNELRMADLSEAFTGRRDPGALVPAVTALRRRLGMTMSLKDAGIPESDLERMAADVMTVTRLLSVNANPVTITDARRIFREAFNGE